MSQPSPHTGPAADARLKRRYASEWRFQALGLAAIGLAVAGLLWLLGDIVSTGYTAFWTHRVDVTVALDEAVLDPDGTREEGTLRQADYRAVLEASLLSQLPEVRTEIAATDERLARLQVLQDEAQADVEQFEARVETLTQDILGLLDARRAIRTLRDDVLDDPDLIGEAIEITVPAAAPVGRWLASGGADTAGLDARAVRILEGLARESTRGAVLATADGGARLRILVELDEDLIDPRGRREEDEIERGDFDTALALGLVKYSLQDADEFLTAMDRLRQQTAAGARLRRTVREVRRERINLGDELLGIVSPSGATRELRDAVLADPGLVGQAVTVTVPVASDVDQFMKGYITTETPEALRTISDRQIAWANALSAEGQLYRTFNSTFFTSPSSTDPVLAGLLTGLVGSILALAVTLVLSVPIGAAAAIYLEEFAPKNAFTAFIEVNINNLAAVPSIVFGLLGLAVFINFFNLPLSSPLVGGLVLSLMTLPTVIIATRAALRAVPPSVREAALGIGASRMQTVFHHVLPLALPGILTGSIIGLAQALGETAPLLMIGMVAYVTDVPTSFTEPAAALPVQIFLWYDRPELGFQELTAAAIMVLLTVMITMNGIAIVLRRRFERRW